MKKPLILLLHLAYWMAYLMLITIVFLALNPMKGGIMMLELFGSFSGLILTLPPLITFYTFYLYLHPRYLQRGRTWRLVLMGTGVILGISALFTCIVVVNLMRRESFEVARTEFLGGMIFFSVLCTVHGVLALVMRGFVVSVGDIRVKEELRRQNTEMELALVKSQLSPHFLFNTLNNIDVLITRDPATASAYLQKLSDILRFMLYESQAETLPLSTELDWVRKYVDLQRIRTANADFVSISVEGDTAALQVAPMTLIPFVENAFKHTEPPSQGCGVSLAVAVRDGEMTFRCENLLVSRGTAPSEPGGLGLPLVQRRLQLLYGDRHRLQLSRQGDHFIALLTLRA